MSDRHRGAFARASGLVYRVIVAAYPPEFRRAYASEMRGLFDRLLSDGLRAGGRAGAVSVWWRALSETIVRLPVEWYRAIGLGRSRPVPAPRPPSISTRNLHMIWSDIRYAVRTLRRAPGFSVVVLTTLALGIGANAAVFSVVHAVVLRPLSFPAPDRLVMAWMQFPMGGRLTFPASEPEYVEFRDNTRIFTSFGSYVVGNTNMSGGDEPLRVRTAWTSANLGEVLGVTPALGRLFVEGEDRPGAADIAVITYALWRRSFGGDSAVVGRTVPMDGRAVEIVGVLPADFTFPERAVGMLRTNTIDPTNLAGRASHYLRMVGRLRPGLTLAAAQAEVDAYVRAWSDEHPDLHGPNANHPIALVGLHDQLVGGVRHTMFLLLGAVLLVLLVACVNVANLFLVRGDAQQRELAIRTALGASRRRVFGLVMTESALVAAGGAMLGLGLAVALVRGLGAIVPPDIPRVEGIQIDGMVLLFTVVATVITGFGFGLVPAIKAARRNVTEVIKDGSSGGDSRTGARFRDLLVVTEIALAVLLVIGAGLMLKTVVRLGRIDPGFETGGILTFRIALPRASYRTGDEITAFYRDLHDRLAQSPGVRSAAGIRTLPLAGAAGLESIYFADKVLDPDGPHWATQYQVVDPGYFSILSIPLVAGRTFDARDDAASEPVIVVNEQFARAYYPGESALGGRFKFGGADATGPTFRIVGVVGDVRQERLDAEISPQAFTARAQAQNLMGGLGTRAATVLVRTDRPPLDVVSSVRAVVRELDPTLPVANIETMEGVVRNAMDDERLVLTLLGAFASLGLLLGAVGIYGLLTYAVARRSRELGVRVAVGAGVGEIRRLVLVRGMTLTAVGVGLGLVGAMLGGRVMSGLLYGTAERDPLVYAGVSVVMGVVALIACVVPARRATKVDPVTVLRSG